MSFLQNPTPADKQAYNVIVQARETLEDQVKRAAYDRELELERYAQEEVKWEEAHRTEFKPRPDTPVEEDDEPYPWSDNDGYVSEEEGQCISAAREVFAHGPEPEAL